MFVMIFVFVVFSHSQEAEEEEDKSHTSNKNLKMTSPIVKGMPYATMRYDRLPTKTTWTSSGVVPTVVSEAPFGNKEYVLVDGKAGLLDCHGDGDGTGSSSSNDDSTSSSAVRVEHEIQIYIPASDFTWLVFFSEPVLVRCSPMKRNGSQEEEDGTMLQIVGSALGDTRDNNSASSPFIIRTAILNTCTTGKNPPYCQQPEQSTSVDGVDARMIPWGREDYGCILRRNAHLYPGPLADFAYAFVNKNQDNNEDDEDETAAILQFDWDLHDTGNAIRAIESSSDPDLIMFSLPHHRDGMNQMMSFSCTGETNSEQQQQQLYCATSMLGPACLIKGSSWKLAQDLPPVSFRAPRPPAPWAISAIADSLRHDITYTLPDYFQRGAGDTYFSGKMLARLGRILLIAEEMGELCSSTTAVGHSTANKIALDIGDQDIAAAYDSACATLDLPTQDHIIKAIASLRTSVEVWINGTAETPFVYDSAWGGVASCGCYFDGSHCQNKFPDCPGFYDSGLNFGNSFYNDMHFHYGYHIFGAAVVAHFDHEWGKRNFENVILLIRNIANPSREDSYFPIMRHMDIFQGHSWASGIAKPVVANGRNQESSSEAIAAYESVALYGKVMASVFERGNRNENEYYKVAKAVRGVGKVMSAMELRSVRRYYHVRQSVTRKAEIFPSAYTPHVVGIMWQSMAQFQTWFGNAPYLAYGIQLLPLTPMAEERDDIDWAKELYPSLAACCDLDDDCAENGWSIFQLSTLATVGQPQIAFERAQTTLASQVFETAGGNGHSLSNTLWYIATRPTVKEPLPLSDIASDVNNSPSTSDSKLRDCHCPGTCTDAVLDTMAESYSCRQRIQWVMKTNGKTQQDACVQVAGSEFPEQCGLCNPLLQVDAVVAAAESGGTDRLPQNAMASTANTKANSSDRDGDFSLTDCHRPETCTDLVLDTIADLYSCRQRMEWVMKTNGKSQQDACVQVAGLEFPEECGLCNPT
jgi:endoglucanase Acf2